MSERFSRTENLIGRPALEKLKKSRVAVFGAGGVGGYCLEALARSGVGAIDIVDNDTVAESNINRQIYALSSTVGKDKADVAKARISDINPDCAVTVHKLFYLPENADEIDLNKYDYIVDAIDTVAAKLCLIERAKSAGVKIISAMGAGNKLDPTGFKVADIYKTSGCPLARVMRLECKKRGIKDLKVVYSDEKAVKPVSEPETGDDNCKRRSVPASIAFVPSVMGLIIAAEVVKDLLKGEE
ncbi:MAG: tRNA threonylcarbamoyladenosine dehydratase, partial [Clostridia bacterium]|nr:tRNA threonylcarbamoyladenosine dehydratase [Clostridia bacterium]